MLNVRMPHEDWVRWKEYFGDCSLLRWAGSSDCIIRAPTEERALTLFCAMKLSSSVPDRIDRF